MKNQFKSWMLPVTGTLTFAAVSVLSAPATPPPLERSSEFLDATNRITGSLRIGMNMPAGFQNPGGSLNPHGVPGHGRRAGHGLPFNYDDGYVWRDSSGNAGGQTWFWGYDNSGQLNASGPNTVDFHRVTAPLLPSEAGGKDSDALGAEITFDHQLGVKEDWHHLRYGVEMAFNYMPFDVDAGGTYHSPIATRTDTYGYTPFTTPPGAPYYGSFGGPGFVLNSTRLNSVTTLSAGNATLQGNYNLNANLWGFRLGPYLERPLSENFSLHFSGGLAVGIIDANAGWAESFTPPGGGTPVNSHGFGSDLKVLWGYYAGMDAVYQLNKHWDIDVGVQLQDVGVYGHNFGGRKAVIDLSQSVFVQLGVSYRF